MKETLIVFQTCCVVCLCVIGQAFYLTLMETRKEAINRGYAEYVVDAEGSTEFKWKENKK